MKRTTVLFFACLAIFTASIIVGCQQPAPTAAPPPKTEPAPAPDMAPKGETKPVESAAATASAPVPAGLHTYNLSPETTIIWAATVPIGTRKGGWTDFTGTIEVEDENIEAAKINAEVKMASVFSDAQEITTKMKGDEHFFAPGKFPISTFKSTSVKKSATGFDVTGDLTIRDKTKSIVFPVTDVKLNGKTLTCKSKVTLNRHDFGVEYNTTIGDYVIQDNCELSLEVIAEAK